MSFLRDLRIAARVLLRSPGFTIVCVLTIGLAIGANAAIFTVVNGVILRPLSYPDAEDLITFSLDASKGGAPELPLSPAAYFHFRDRSRGFERMGGYLPQLAPLASEGGEPVQVVAALTTASLFPALGVAPLLGRTFTGAEDVPNGPALIILSHAIWQSRFGADPAVVGRTVEVNGSAREVIGVMPPGFAFPSADTDVWVPLRLDPSAQQFGAHFITPVVRLRDGVTIEAAHAEVTSLIARFAEAGYSPAYINGVFTGGATVMGLREAVIGDAERPLLIVLGALAVVFLIACSNIANLFLVRERTRLRETAVRLALGATRGRLVRHTLAESAVISIAAGLLGVLLAATGTRVLLALRPAAIPRLHEVGLGLPVFGFIALISLAAAVLLGVLPALKAGAVHVSDALREGGRSGTAGRESQALRGFLVVMQVAMAVILLVGAGLMVRSAEALRKVDTGFDAEGVLAFTVTLPYFKYGPAERTAPFFEGLADAIAAKPRVEAVGAIDVLPLSGVGPVLGTVIEGRPLAADEFPPVFHVRRAAPGYFDAMRIPVLDGRAFEPNDHRGRLGRAVISANVRGAFWPGTSPLGRRLAPGGGAMSRIVGVVGDVRATGLDEPFDPLVYLPMADSMGAPHSMTFVVRATGDPMLLVPAIRSEITKRDSNVPITDVHLVEKTVADSMGDLTFTMLLLSIAAGIALVLGCVGIYGLISYVVGQRTAEIGIRMSLGAEPWSVMRLFLRHAWLLAGIGIGIGVLASLAATRLLGALIYGISALDATTFVLAPALFFVIATAACLVPAGRAAAVDPAIAMRRG